MESSAMIAMRRTTSCGVMELTARCSDAGDCAASAIGTPAATRTEASLNTMRSSTRMGDDDGRNRETNAPGRTVVRPGASVGSAGSGPAAAQLGLRLVLRGRIASRLRPRWSAARLIAGRRPRLGARRVVARRLPRLRTRFAAAVVAGAIDPRAVLPLHWPVRVAGAINPRTILTLDLFAPALVVGPSRRITTVGTIGVIRMIGPDRVVRAIRMVRPVRMIGMIRPGAVRAVGLIGPIAPAVVTGAADRGTLGRRNDAPAAQIGTAHAAALVVVDRALPFTAQDSAVVPAGPVPEDEAGLGTQGPREDNPGATVVAVRVVIGVVEHYDAEPHARVRIRVPVGIAGIRMAVVAEGGGIVVMQVH